MSFVLEVRIPQRDIVNVMKRVRSGCRMSHRLNASEMTTDFNRAFDLMKRNTMVATGETLSKAYKLKKTVFEGTIWQFGYLPTTNNQSFHQEFGTGKVHRTTASHYSLMGNPKCSRVPVDLFSRYGSYKSNPRATRAAMRKAINFVFRPTSITFAKSGNNIYYVPGLRPYVKLRSTRIAAAFKMVGLS